MTQNDILLNLYKDIYLTLNNCGEIENLIIYYINDIIHVVKKNYKYEYKIKKIKKILKRLHQELKNIYIAYRDLYEDEMDKIRTAYIRIDNIKNNDYIIDNHINIIEAIC